MKRKFPFYFLLIVLATNDVWACNPCMKKLKSEAKKNWKYDPDKKYYMSGKFVYGFDSTYKSCLVGLSLKQVKKMFGEPTQDLDKSNRVGYRISPPISPNYHADLYFVFDKELKLKSTGIIHSQGISIDD